MTGTVGDARRQKAAEATPESVATGAQQAAGTATTKAKENPIPPSLVAGFAAGVVVGWIVWSRR